MVRYFLNLLISLDQLLNTIFGGYPDETISSRAGKAKRREKAWGCALCKVLDFFDTNHCRDNIEEDEGKYRKNASLPP